METQDTVVIWRCTICKSLLLTRREYDGHLCGREVTTLPRDLYQQTLRERRTTRGKVI